MADAIRVIVFLLLTIAGARGQEPAAAPALRIETGVHQSTIRRMAMLPGGKSFATVSDDQTARVWSLDGLQAAGVIRPPIGPDDTGKLAGVAASGNLLMIAGRIRYPGNRFGVQFYRLPDLKFVTALSALPAPVSALRLSLDGQVLLVGLVGSQGIRAFDVRHGGIEIWSDRNYVGQVQWIDVDAQGRVVASGEDGRIRLYDPNHRLVAQAPLPKGARPYAVTFSPNGQWIAAGDQARPQAWLLDASTLRPQQGLVGAAGRTGGFGIVAFPHGDSDTLLGGGSYQSTAGDRLLRRWSLARGEASDAVVGTNTVTDILSNGPSTLVTTAEPAIVQLDGSGLELARRMPSNMEFRDYGQTGFAVSHDGMSVQLPIDDPAERVVFDVRTRATRLAMLADAMARPMEAAGGLHATAWHTQVSPKLNGRPVTLEPDERSLSVAVLPNGQGAVFGTDFSVRFQRANGPGWRTITPAPAWAVNVSGDGRLVVAGLGDGTVRWYEAATGREILTLFRQRRGGHWVLSTPDGSFDHDTAAPGQSDGRSLIGYEVNDPNGETSQFIEVGQLYTHFFRPDLVGLALRSSTVTRGSFQEYRGSQAPIGTVLNGGLPASITLVATCEAQPDGKPACRAPPSGVEPAAFVEDTHDDHVTVVFRLVNANGAPGRAAIFRNGAAILPVLTTQAEDAHSRTQQAIIPLGIGANLVEIRPVSDSGQIEAARSSSIAVTVTRTLEAPPAGSPVAPPTGPHRTLYLLSVGVSAFDEPKLSLENASNDARAITGLMAGKDPPVYDTSVSIALYDADATVAAITAAMHRIAEQAQADDLVVMFFAGHGEEVDGHYYFAPRDFGVRNPDLLKRALAPVTPGVADPEGDAALAELFRREGLGPEQMTPEIQAIRAARVAIILDTCYSASLATQDTVFQHDANKTATNAIGHATGRFVLSSATTLAIDAATTVRAPNEGGVGHGLFTSFMLDALQGSADMQHTGRVNVVQLADYTISHVKAATLGHDLEQEPTFYFAGSDFFNLKTSNRMTP